MRRLGIVLAVTLLAGPALAIDPAASRVTCAAAVTRGEGTMQTVRDLDPSELPVLAYNARPGEREFKQLALIGEVPVRLFAYRVNEQVLRLRIYEDGPDGPALLADSELAGDMTQLSYRPLGGDTLVTAYCY
jgi:hypothetical protein